MAEMIQIRTIKQYFNEFVVEGLKGKEKVGPTDLIPIKQNILNAFKKEIFERIDFKLGDKAKTMSRDDLAELEAVKNILTQSFRRWKRLCILCSEYGLGSFFQLEDLQQVLNDENEPDPEEVIELPNTEEDVTDQLTEEPVYLEKEDSHV